MHSSRMSDAYRPLFTARGVALTDPLGPPLDRAWTEMDRQTPVRILPCPKLRLRAKNIPLKNGIKEWRVSVC